MKKIFLSFLLVMAGISHTLAQGLDGNVEQRLKDFFIQQDTRIFSYLLEIRNLQEINF